jgi:hypothetical protein
MRGKSNKNALFCFCYEANQFYLQENFAKRIKKDFFSYVNKLYLTDLFSLFNLRNLLSTICLCFYRLFVGIR